MTEHPDACPRCGYALTQPAPPPPPPPASFVPHPAAPPPPARPARERGLSAASVPKILLGLGAACLLVAAVIFLAVAWRHLGVDGRTAVLVALTALSAGLGQVFLRRELTVAAEALTTIALGLVAIDLFGARHAGWLGTPSEEVFLTVLGAGLLGAATAAFLPDRSLHVPQLVAPVGLGAAVLGLAGVTGHPQLLATTGTLALAALLVLGRRWSAELLQWTAGVLAATAFTFLAGLALLDASSHPSFHALWLGRHGLGLLAGTALLLLPWAVFRRNDDVRELTCAASVSALTWTVAVPVLDEGVTPITLAGCAAAVVWAGASAAAPQRWRLVTRTPLVGSLAVALAVPAVLAAQAAVTLGSVAAPFTAEASVRLDPAAHVGHPLLLPLGVAVAVLSLVSVLPDRRAVRPALGVAYVGALLTGALYPLPLWVFVVATGPVGLLLAPPSAVLTLGVLAELVVLAAYLVLRRTGPVATLAGLALPLSLAGTVWTAGHVFEVPLHHASLAALVLVGLLAVARPRIELEVSAVLAGSVSVYAGVLLSPDWSVWAAVHLTVAGALVVLTALVHRDRRACAWPGGVLLVLATWVRLHDVGVEAPEPYTLPAAVALLLVGLDRMRRDPGAGTLTALLPGLTLATVPTLLWALAYPLSTRAVVSGLVCLVLLLGGAALRWSAPVLVGWVSGAALVLRELAPYAEQTPQWVLIGTAGTLLIGAGVTWEARVRDLRRTAAYLGRLR